MADEKITVEWIATAQQMVKTLDQMDKRFERQEKLLQKMTDTGKKGASEVAGSFNKLEQELKDNEAALKKLVIGSKEFDEQRKKVDMLRGSLNRAKGELTGMQPHTFGEMKTAMLGSVAAAGLLFAALTKVADAQREIVSQGADAAIVLDTMARKFQIQAGLNDPEREAASRAIIQQSSDAGVKAEQGFRTATALASSDFKDALKNGTLKIALEGMQGTSFTGSPEEYVSAMSQALSAYGLDKTPQNLQDIQIKLAGLFKATDFQAAELTDFAKNASVLEMAGMSPAQALAGFGALREKGTAEAASVQMRNVSLGMMAPNSEGAKAIRSLGLKPEQLDMVGESFTDALTTLKTAVDKLPKEDQVPTLEHMFGKENTAGAQNLMKAIPRIKELEGLQNNPQALARDVETAKGSMQAAVNRRENQAILGGIANAVKIATLDDRIKAAEDRNRLAIQNAAVSDVPGLGVAAQGAAVFDNSVTAVTGQDIGGGLGDILSATLGGWFKKSDENQARQIQLQQEANELAKQRQQPAARQPAQAARPVRPGEAPLPGGLVP